MNNPFVQTVCSLIDSNPMRVTWMGDYSSKTGFYTFYNNDTKYQIFLEPHNDASKDMLKLLSKLLGGNFISAKKQFPIRLNQYFPDSLMKSQML